MASIVFILFITVGVPVTGCVYAIYKRRFIPFLLGVLAFVISQMLIRIPLLEYLAAESSSYLMWSVKYPVSFVIFLAFSAGIFEELARWIAMRFFMKQRDSLSGVILGIGHGGIEAFLIVGLTVLATMNSFADSQLYWLSGLERMIAISLHIGLSLIVLAAVKQKRFSYVLVAIGLHGIINTFAGILSVSLIAIEIVLLILTIITILIAYSLLRKDEKL